MNQIINEDCLYILMYLESECIDLCFTSPPYFNAKDYGDGSRIYRTYDEYLKFLECVFREVHRVTKEGRFFVLNISPVLEPRLSRSHQSKRYPIPFDLHPLLRDIGWDMIDDIIWEKPDPSVKDRNSQFRNNRKPLTYKPNIVTEYVMVYRKKTDKLIDWNLKQYSKDDTQLSLVLGETERTNIWKISPKSSKHHPAIFPEELCERVIKYYSYVGDVVLDPFCGLGATCKVAKQLKRQYVGIEKNEEYFLKALENLK